jgi:hypothetical protein
MANAEKEATMERGKEAGPDAEVWVRNQVMLAIKMALAMKAVTSVRADEDAFEAGIHGVATGASVEILRTLGFTTHNLVNLRMGKERNTIAELEKILNSNDAVNVEVLPDGSVRAK